MTEERLALALRRMERALLRAEAAAEERASRPDPAFVELTRKHERLRERAQEAISALDRLIGTA